MNMIRVIKTRVDDYKILLSIGIVRKYFFSEFRSSKSRIRYIYSNMFVANDANRIEIVYANFYAFKRWTNYSPNAFTYRLLCIYINTGMSTYLKYLIPLSMRIFLYRILYYVRNGSIVLQSVYFFVIKCRPVTVN